MSVFREIPPTAGLPIYFRDFFSFIKPGCLEDDFKKYLGLNYLRVTNSGTTAFYLILESLKELSTKSTVIIPSYVCPLLPLAIKRAGLEVEVCDICPESFDFNPDELERICSSNNDILAVVAVHLAGIPVDLSFLEKAVKKCGIFIIEDCAQALGAEYQGKKAGTLGDFSFFSLARGKGLTIYEGGIVAASKEQYAKLLDQKIKMLIRGDFFSEGLKVLELFGYWIFYRPFLFWFVFRLPQIFWNLKGDEVRASAEYFTVDFPKHEVSKIRKSLGRAQLLRLEGQISVQREKAFFYINCLKSLKGVRIIREGPGMKATYPYLTFIFDNPGARDKALELLNDSGLGASVAYAYAIGGYDYLKEIIPRRDYPGGRYLAEHAITLSTSTFLEMSDLDSAVNIIKNL